MTVLFFAVIFIIWEKQMDEEILIAKEREIYTKYQEIICPCIVELEVRDGEYPIEILNEIRAILTHLSRFKLQNKESDLFSADNHVKRAILDCYKYLCVSIAENITKFRQNYRKVDLKLANNGIFLPELDRLENQAKDAFKIAKLAEIKKTDEDKQYQLYECAYNAYSIVDEYIEASHEAILFASSHSKKSNILTIVSCIVTVISIIVAVIALF